MRLFLYNANTRFNRNQKVLENFNTDILKLEIYDFENKGTIIYRLNQVIKKLQSDFANIDKLLYRCPIKKPKYKTII